MMKVDRNWVGKKVRALDKEEAYAPYKGAIGTVLEFDGEDEDMPCRVLWDDNQLDMWIIKGSIELVEDDSTIISYDEIWEMLRPKMEKNGLKSHFAYVRIGATVDDDKVINTYDEEDVRKCIALAYKMGYERAMKGRPFKYGEEKAKKVEGHWEKVDLNNLPKNGTRVRFARNGEQNHLRWSGMKIGDTGVVEIDGTFGVKPDHFKPGDYPWVAFSTDSADSLDYWVEGDDAD